MWAKSSIENAESFIFLFYISENTTFKPNISPYLFHLIYVKEVCNEQ